MAKIWLYRRIFDPIHEWHYNYINNSISDLNIDNLKLIVKILWKNILLPHLSKNRDDKNLNMIK